MFRILELINVKNTFLKLYEEGAISRVKNIAQKRLHKKYKDKECQNDGTYNLLHLQHKRTKREN